MTMISGKINSELVFIFVLRARGGAQGLLLHSTITPGRAPGTIRGARNRTQVTLPAGLTSLVPLVYFPYGLPCLLLVPHLLFLPVAISSIERQFDLKGFKCDKCLL